MAPSSEVSFDPIHHTVTVDGRTVELQPRSFRLLVELNEHANHIVSSAALTESVWGKVTVAPDTLKQRVFLLRKSLEDAGVDSLKIQSVRGEGYRLLVDHGEPDLATTRSPSRYWLALPVLILVAAAILVWATREPYEPPANNRVVFWSDIPSEPRGDDYARWQELWADRVSASGEILFVASRRDRGKTIPEQARITRSGLVSLWSAFEREGQFYVRMQIVEPKTASVLRSDVASIDDDATMLALIEQQFAAISRVVRSGVLPLGSDALVDTDDPAWARLRALANEP